MTVTTTATARPPKPATTTTAPGLPEELLAVLKRMRLPYLRDAAPELATQGRHRRNRGDGGLVPDRGGREEGVEAVKRAPAEAPLPD
ncbi:hypothetical protein [Nocardioides marmoriginsengisoli]|uniref:hypothetical protein n=1 Tax=Nocardioides marmoriginsengisoli TaxID=661483 RepID=UPI001C83D202|nr:hypothetical protein [Nocardioides marmoriginsengisoli]